MSTKSQGRRFEHKAKDWWRALLDNLNIFWTVTRFQDGYNISNPDVQITTPRHNIIIEVKARKKPTGWKWIYDLLQNNDIAHIWIKNEKHPYVCMRGDTFEDLLEQIKEYHGRNIDPN